MKFFRSFDGYGEPVQLSYKGDTNYKTKSGALLTIAMQAFMLAFTLTEVISLLNYENAAISQYTVLDSRSNGGELNLQESFGEFLFGFVDLAGSKFVEPNPTICSLKMQVVSVDWSNA